MNREILFKAKRIDNGEWVEGNLFVDDKGEKYEILVGYINYRIAWEVDPQTTCQYTGLTDKNGNKIWENDVVKGKIHFTTGYKMAKGCIKYYINAFKLMIEHNDKEIPFSCEVIGNVFDNPELLKQHL